MSLRPLAALATATILVVGGAGLRANEPTPPTDEELTAVEPMSTETVLAGPKVEWDEYERRVRDWALDLGIAQLTPAQLADAANTVDAAAVELFLGEGDDTYEHDLDSETAQSELMLRSTVLCWHLPFDHQLRDGELCDGVTPPAAMFVPGYSRAAPGAEDYDEYTEFYP